jgi:hypothetical protein
MSSIKRDVKKKVLPRPEGEKILSRVLALRAFDVDRRVDARKIVFWFGGAPEFADCSPNDGNSMR